MSDYIKEKNKITITNLEHFNIEHILECGQVFLFEKCENYYEVVSGNEYARIFTYPEKVEILCTNEDYFENYFDLKTDYSKIKQNLSTHLLLKQAIEYGYGMRILKQGKLETIIGFIISANNNINRIKNSMKKLREQFGTKTVSKLGEYYAFPTLDQLSVVSTEQFVSLGTGYRAPHLVKAIEQLKQFDLEQLSVLETANLKNKLIKLQGIGSKVADCILLFSYYRTDVVPVDTWVEKVYNKYFSQNNQIKNREIIREEFFNIFTKLSGYAQQYLFYYERQFGKFNKNDKIG